jgi:hypothetical protein
MNRMERLDMEERFVQLGADALMRRHPQGAWLADKGRARPIPLTDAALEAACERLAAWLAEHETDGD